MSFFDDTVRCLTDLSPPVEAFGIGGSVGAGKSDDLADLDFFLLVPTEQFREFTASFPTLIRHPKPLIASRIRGFTAFFGYQFTFIYDDCSSVDYFINCPLTLQSTPMAHKTRVLRDLTGYFTAFHQTLPGRADDQQLYLRNTTAELLWEALRIRKYVKRQDLIALVHRLERIRLVTLALERYLHNDEYFIPHDADKWIARDLGDSIIERLEPTFPSLSPRSISKSFLSIWKYATDLLRELDINGDIDSGTWELLTNLSMEIQALLIAAA